MKKIQALLNHSVEFSENITVSIKDVIILIIVLAISSFVINLIRKVLVRKLPTPEKKKFIMVFSYIKWVVYTVIFLLTLQSVGVNVTAVLAASAALLIGVGLALQTFFQDIISGIFIIIDRSIQVDDIIEIDGKIGKVEEIKLRTTRAVTIDNKVLIIPNHLYLTKSLYNWTQNGTETRESIEVGVAYGSDVKLVKKLLLQVANEHPAILPNPEPIVVFTDFGDSSLKFKLIFTLKESFMALIPQSDLRFRVDELFREHNITIPFPQRDIHIIEKSKI